MIFCLFVGDGNINIDDWVVDMRYEVISGTGYGSCESCDFTRSNCLIYIKSEKKSGKLSTKSGKIRTFTSSVLTLHRPLGWQLRFTPEILFFPDFQSDTNYTYKEELWVNYYDEKPLYI